MKNSVLALEVDLLLSQLSHVMLLGFQEHGRQWHDLAAFLNGAVLLL